MNAQAPVKNSSQGTTTPTFESRFTSPTGKTYTILPMTSRDLEEVVELSTNTFVNAEAHFVHINMTYDDFSGVFRVHARRSIEDGLGIIVRDDQGKLASAEIILDQYNYYAKPLEDMPLSKNADDMLGFADSLILEGYKPTAPYDVIYFFAISVDPAYAGQKIATEVLRWMVESHPVISKVRALFTQAISPISIAIFEKLGWKTADIKDAQLYENAKGERPFNGLGQTIKKLNLGKFDASRLMVKDVIPIVDSKL